MFQLSDGHFTNKNGGILWYKEVKWSTKTVLCSLRVIILPIKEWTKVYSLFDFSTVGLELYLDMNLPCAISGICSPSI